MTNEKFMTMRDYFGRDFRPKTMSVVTTHDAGEVGTITFNWGEHHTKAAIHAIGSHDDLVKRVRELEEFVESLHLDTSDDMRRCQLMSREW